MDMWNQCRISNKRVPEPDFLWLLGGGMDYEAARIDVKSPVRTTIVLVRRQWFGFRETKKNRCIWNTCWKYLELEGEEKSKHNFQVSGPNNWEDGNDYLQSGRNWGRSRNVQNKAFNQLNIQNSCPSDLTPPKECFSILPSFHFSPKVVFWEPQL